ncbi:phosphodiester glycosidase family protein [Aureimonas pseudogalii]|uniref:Uncharacterized protein YigE (DUF2233 family) n=1 Tax=Aureimonas pseudogalii TaxID=1744844 RepID=A0A7W6MM72_9HYPH|nr:phosphodiester glycosidase family protein [Aureimonas pseudogalii]MBB4000543.1 uncharacterized protein YigE (DUF2233 family) [Aureimonas pseudogalii]
MTWRFGWLALAMLVAGADGARAEAAKAQTCAKERFEDADSLVCTIDPAASDLRLFWRDRAGAPYRRFAALSRSVEADGGKLAFAMNAGMYQTDFSPVGLYVENGAALRPVETTVIDGPPGRVPNFYKAPNGVFFLDRASAGILTTEAFTRKRPDVRFATQSGPMLVIEGRLHPAFIPGSTDRTRRSGVGVCENGQVRFAISETDVNFHDFARLFRDHLACPNALFLDGGRGAGIYSPAFDRDDVSWHGGYGPMFGLVE